MIKKMRWRLTIVAMAAFLAIIVLVAFLVNVVNYYNVTSRVDDTISFIMATEKRDLRSSDSGNLDTNKPLRDSLVEFPDVESNYMNRFFTVCFDKEGNIESSSTDYVASISETDAREYALKVYKNDSDSGYIDEYRYRMQKVDDSTIIVFLNVSREQQYMKSLRNLSLVVAMGSLTLVFILIMIFSKSVVIPIEKNINMQKRFITDASHELKTPLTSISTSLDVITMVHGEDEWTENIKNQTNRMSKLVSELVTLSKLDEELPLPNKEKFSLSSAAWEIIGIYEQQAKGKNKKLTLDIAEDVSMVGEKASIQQMLSVLIDNAIRYSDDNGEIKLSIYKKRKKVVIEVFNTCQLEKVPDVKRLFDRFYRPDDSRNIKTGGNGIGLAIAKAVAETHGGTIEALCPDGKTMTMKVVI